MDEDAVTPGPAGRVCRCCGEPIPEGNLAWNYPLPDPVALLTGQDLADRVLFRSQRIMSVRELGNFIYVILPVPVQHDREATFGIWLNVPQIKVWNRVMEAGRQGGESWAGVRFVGRVATAVRPWPEVFGAWAPALVSKPDEAPRLVHSEDRALARVLATPWPEEAVRSSRDQHVPVGMTGGPTPSPYAD
jgi:hypothetical protein